MTEQAIIGAALVLLAVVLLFAGMPRKNGEMPRFLRFQAARMIYAPLILATFVLGVAELISAFSG